MPDELEMEAEIAAFDLDAIQDEDRHPGQPSGFGCPDCGGTLWELQEGELIRFRCRVGHAWTANGLLAGSRRGSRRRSGRRFEPWRSGRPSATGSPSGCAIAGPSRPPSASRSSRSDAKRRAADPAAGPDLRRPTTNDEPVPAGPEGAEPGDVAATGRTSRMDEPTPQPPAFDVVALVASAGGLAALRRPAAAPARRLPGRGRGGPAPRPQPSQPAGGDPRPAHPALPVSQARHGDRLRPGAVFVAPPDRHLLVDRDGVLSLTETERIHFVRPSADLLLESVGAAFGRRAIAVVLTGAGPDGADGVRIVKQMGGTVIAQDRPTSQ